MSTKKKLPKLMRNLRQSSNKLEGVFKTTQFERILEKCILDLEQENLSLGNYPLEMIKAGLLSQLLQSRSQRDFVETLNSAASWRGFCNFNSDVPVQSTFSRAWNNQDLIKVLDKIL